jgi:hypothetical protein
MSYNSLKYISSARRARAELIRSEAWTETLELIRGGRIGSAYRCMVNACARAWRIESAEEH